MRFSHPDSNFRTVRWSFPLNPLDKHVVRNRWLAALLGIIVGFGSRAVSPEEVSWVLLASLLLSATLTLWRGRSIGICAFASALCGEIIAARLVREHVGLPYEFALLLATIATGSILIGQVHFVREKAYKLLKRNEGLERTVRENAMGIFNLNESGVVIGANRAAGAFFGLVPGHLIGRVCTELPWGTLFCGTAESSINEILGLSQDKRSGPAVFFGTRLNKSGEVPRQITISVTEDFILGGMQVQFSCEGDSVGARNDVVPKGDYVSQRVVPLRVCYLDHTAEDSGGEIALARLLEAFDPDVVKPIIVLANDGPLVARLREAGFFVKVIKITSLVTNVRKDSVSSFFSIKIFVAFSVIAYGLKVGMFIRKNNIDIIHTNSLKSDFYGIIASFVAQRPLIWHVRDHISSAYLPTFAVQIVRFCAQHVPSYIIANSESTLDSLQLKTSNDSAIISSGIQTFGVVYDGLRKSNGSLTAKGDHKPLLRVLLMGRLTQWKGQHVFIEAARQLIDRGLKVQFLIAGAALFKEQEYEQSLHELVKKLNLGDHVKFLGHVNAVHSLLDSVDILVHASISPEPFGQVVIEAMAAGLPVIATDGGGVRETVRHGETGLLVPMNHSVAMANAIEYLIENPDIRNVFGENGRERVRTHFTSVIMASKVQRIYLQLRSGKHE